MQRPSASLTSRFGTALKVLLPCRSLTKTGLWHLFQADQEGSVSAKLLSTARQFFLLHATTQRSSVKNWINSTTCTWKYRLLKHLWPWSMSTAVPSQRIISTTCPKVSRKRSCPGELTLKHGSVKRLRLLCRTRPDELTWNSRVSNTQAAGCTPSPALTHTATWTPSCTKLPSKDGYACQSFRRMQYVPCAGMSWISSAIKPLSAHAEVTAPGGTIISATASTTLPFPQASILN